MSVVSVKELARKNIYEINKSRQLSREFVIVLSDNVLSSPMAENVPFDNQNIPDISTAAVGHTHPTYTNYKCRKVTYTEGYEGSPYHVHVLCEYGVVSAREVASPTNRANLWEFDTAPGEVPALAYYDGGGNSTLRPLTNSAFDYFPGLVTQEALVSAKVTQNFAALPTSWIGAQNFTNDSGYLGGPQHTWKVAGVRIAQAEEEFGGNIVRYWQATAELHYRQSGHNLQLPDIGWNFIGGGQKRRAMVFDFENSEWIASPNPVGLDGNGGLTLNAPAILNRRVLPVTNFQTLFGNPPTAPIS
jgi:hypothetical protein